MDPLVLAGGAALLFLLMGKKDESEPDSGGDGGPDGSSGGMSFSDPNAPTGGGAMKHAYQGKVSQGDAVPTKPAGESLGFAGPEPAGETAEIDLADFDRVGPGQSARLGNFYQIAQGDNLSNIAQAALADGAYRAYGLVTGIPIPADGEQYPSGDDHDRALGLAKKMIDNPIGMKLWQMILMSPWNDMVYGTWGMGTGGTRGPCGRGIRLVPKYFPNRSALAAGDPPVRSFPVLDQSYGSNGSNKEYKAQPIGGAAAGNKYPYIWIPGIEIASLLDTTGGGLTIAGSGSWQIPGWPGKSYGQINPPPPIFNRSFSIPAGWGPTVDAESVPEWGCNQWAIENWI